jgi:hypothetical protein
VVAKLSVIIGKQRQPVVSVHPFEPGADLCGQLAAGIELGFDGPALQCIVVCPQSIDDTSARDKTDPVKRPFETDLPTSFFGTAMVVTCVVAVGVALVGFLAGLFPLDAVGLLFVSLVAGVARWWVVWFYFSVRGRGGRSWLCNRHTHLRNYFSPIPGTVM